jgi:hypothetical protein
MKIISKFEDYIKENQLTIATDEEIISELRNLLKGSKYDKGGIIEQRADQLVKIQAPWIKLVRDKLSAEEIASKLITYEKNLER